MAMGRDQRGQVYDRRNDHVQHDDSLDGMDVCRQRRMA